MSIIGSLAVKLGIVTTGFDAAMNNSKSKVKDFESAVGSANKILGAFGVSLGLAGAVQGVRAVIDYADQVDDLGKAFDLSTAKVLQFRDALGQSGGKAENAERILGALFDKIETAKNSMVTDDVAKQFAKLGLSIQDLKTMQPEQALTAVFNGLSKIGNTYERVALIKDILGKSGLGLDVKNLAALIEQSTIKFESNAAALNKVADAADRLERAKEKTKIFFGGVFGDLLEGLDKINDYANNHPKLMWVLGKLFPAGKLIGEAESSLFGNETAATSTPAVPGNYFGLNAPQSSFTFGAESAVASAFGKGKQSIREFKLGVAAKDIETSATAVKEFGEALTEVVVTARQLETGKLNIDELLASKHATAEIESQLALEKERLELQGQSYNLTAQERKIAEIELNKRQQINHLQEQLNDLKFSEDNPINIKAKEDQLNAQIDMVNQLADAEKNLANQEEAHRTSFKSGWLDAYASMVETATNYSQEGEQIFGTVMSNMGNAISNFTHTGKFEWNKFRDSVIADISAMILKLSIMRLVMATVGMFRGGVSVNTDTISSDFIGSGGIIDLSNPNLPRRASGGMLDRPSIVGENGAELFVPNRPGTIIPNARMGDFMGSQPQMVVNGIYIASMSAIDTQSAQQFLAKNRQSVFAANQSAMRGLPAGR